MARKKKKEKRGPQNVTSSNTSTIRPIEDHSFWSKHLFKILLIMALAIGLYVQGVHYGYVLDDVIVIEDNQFTSQGVHGIWDILTNESMTGYFGEQKNLIEGNRYRPLSLITFAIEVSLFGKNPTAHHAVNIGVYALTCIAVFWMLYLLLTHRDSRKDTWLGLAFLAALIFTVHPVHTEAVANIKGRDEIMALLFSSLALIAVVKYIDLQKVRYLVIGLLSFFLGLLSKENTVTFIVIIPTALYFFRNANRKEYSYIISGLLLTFIAYLILRFSVSGVPDLGLVITDVMNNPFYGMSSSQKYATISYTLLKYLGLSLAPIQLSHDYYPYAIPILNPTDYRAILGVTVYLGLVYYMIKKWKSRSIMSFAILFYLAALSIVSNIVINVGTFMNERFIFVSSVGACLVLAYIVRFPLRKMKVHKGMILSSCILSLVVLLYGYRTFSRVPVWESALTLNESAVKVSSNSARANSFMATALYNQAREKSNTQEKKMLLTEALDYSEKAAQLIPNYKNANLMKAGISGELHRLDGDLEGLLKRFREVVSNRPDIPYIIEYLEYLSGSRITDQELINFYYQLGYEELLLNRSNARWAMHYLSKAYAIEKNSPELNKAIGDTYLQLGDQSKAHQFYQAAGIN